MRRNRTRRPRPSLRRPYFRPCLEELESRLAPSTTPVDVLDWRGAVPGNNSGVNANETQLTPSTVNPASFGQLFNDPVDGSIYGEPLVKTNVNINGVMHNVVYVATEHDSVYAFDADNPGPALWHVSFINPAQGINVVPNSVTGSGDIAPEIGISNTMMIDPTTGTLYTTAKTQDTVNGVNHYVITLYALNIATGAIEHSTVIGDTVLNSNGTYTNTTNVSIPGTGQDSSNGVVTFNALRENERDGLFEDPATGLLYLTFTSHGDVTPVHGWILGYDPNTLQLKSVFNTTPDGGLAEIWMGQGMPAVDANGNIYAATGNGTFDHFFSPAPGPNALGPGGGGLGYGPDTPAGSNTGGIHNSMAIKFDLYNNNGEGSDSTGIFFNGDSPTVGVNPGDESIDLTSTGINLHSGDHFSVTLAYDNTAHTLTETITDLDNSSISPFTQTYTNVNLPSELAGNLGYVGFTGGTGGLTAVQNVNSWSLSAGGSQVLNYANFSTPTNLTANGSAKFNNGSAELTDGGASEAGSVFYNNQVNVSNGFTTTFTFQLTNANADGFTFTIQNAPATQPGPDYGNSVLKISPTSTNNPNGVGVNGGPAMQVTSSFTPSDQAALNNSDLDQGSGGVLLLPSDVGSAAHPNLILQTGKEGEIYLLDANSLGGYNPVTNGPDNVVQVLPPGTVGGGSYDTPAFLDLGGGKGLIYYMGQSDVLKAFEIDNGVINPTPVAQTSQVFGFPGASPFITTDGSGDGIVWVLDNHLNGTNGAANGPSVLHAYDALTLQQLYTSSEFSSDTLGGAVKFTVPTVANGHVYVGTQTGLYVFGLLPAPRPPVVQVVHTCSQEVDLSWTPTANDHYVILESTDDVHFKPIATVASNVTTYSVTGLTQPGEYYFEVEAFNQNGSSAVSTPVHAFVGEPTIIDHSSGFTDHSDLVANGTTAFPSGMAQLINGANGEAGSIFSTQKVDIRQFNTTFTFQFTGGTNPIADGLAFVIQGSSSTALGGAGGGLGYSGINNSLAVTFRAYNDGSLPDNDSSSELEENGTTITSTDITAATNGGINFNTSAHASTPDVYSVTLSYNGSTLTETITDTNNGAKFTDTYNNINLPALVGGDTAYVGFTGGTGGLNTTGNVLTWKYTPTTQNLPPAAPTNLQVVNVTTHDDNRDDVSLTWVCNSYNETGFAIQRSTDGVNWTMIATVPANTMSYNDLKLDPGTYYYRVYAFNANGNSSFSNVDSVILGAPRQTTTAVDHSSGFADHSDLTSNGSNKFVTTSTGAVVDELVDGGSSEAGSVFTTSRVLVSNFDTTFTFQFHGGTTPPADGMAFVLQGASPTALGGLGGGLGYGSDHYVSAGGAVGITPSVAIKFDIYSNEGEGTDSTGIFTDGRSPTLRDPALPVTPTPLIPDQSVDMTGSGINLSSGDVFQVHLTYDGTTLNETITDTNTGAVFTHSYAVDIPSIIGGDVAYAGFTGGTGGLTTIADVRSWTYSFVEPKPGQGGPTTASPNTGGGAAASSTSTLGTSLAALASGSNSTPGTNTLLMNPNPTPTVPNGSTNFVGNLSSLSSGWSAFQATTLGPIVRASDTPPPAPAMDPAPSELPALDQLFTDLGSGGSLDPLALDSGEIATT